MNKPRNVETRITSYLFSKASKKLVPLYGSFELSPICNFNCKMCYVHMSQEDVRKSGKKMMSYDDWISLAKQAKKEGMLYLLLTGGEPFLYPRFRELFEELSEMGFIVSINSNGSLIDDDVIKWLKKKAPSRINITLYGASNETYQRLTGDAHGFDKVSQAIKKLQDAHISIKLNCSLTPYNVQDLEKIIQFSNERNLMLEVASYMFPAIRLSNENIGKNSRFTPRKTAEYIIKTFELQHGKDQLNNFAENVLLGINPCYLEECDAIEADGNIRCRAGKSSFWVTWHGDILPCGMMSCPSITYDGINFNRVWKELVNKTAQIKLSGKCSICANKDICHVCAAMAYAETGDFKKTPTYLCEMVNAMHSIALDIINDKKEGN